jgi:predicted GNAT family acetyltransferase
MFKQKNVALNLGLIDDVPAATSLIIYSNEKKVATVEQISTLQKYRGRGVGTAITMVSVQQMCAHSVETAVLHATKAGERIYKKIGFKAYFRIIEVIYRNKSN